LIRERNIAKQSGDLEQKADAEMRLSFLRSLRSRIKEETIFSDRPRLFVSYSKINGSTFYARTESRAKEMGFEVLNGFIKTEDTNVLRAIRTAVFECNVFLAILTPELAIGDAGSAPWFAPSVWVVEEKGMALGLGKPFHMLVHERVHKDFWHRTTPHQRHDVFSESDFDGHLENALIALNSRYEEQQMASAGITSTEMF
jgi:hypothetical protein